MKAVTDLKLALAKDSDAGKQFCKLYIYAKQYQQTYNQLIKQVNRSLEHIYIDF